MLIVLPLAFFVVGLLISAGIALWRRHFRQMASSILAIAVIPICYVVIAKAPFFDPWLWYVIANHTRFEALAESNSPSSGPKFAVIETRDVSAGLVINGNHFIDLVYDESDAIGLEPSERPSIWQTRTVFGACLSLRANDCTAIFLEWMNLNSAEMLRVNVSASRTGIALLVGVQRFFSSRRSTSSS